MKFHTSIGPNPRVVKMFMEEKGIKLDEVTIDLMGGENRRPEWVAKNPSGQSPGLELDDGSMLTEITAICEYLDEKYPGTSLLGDSAEERAKSRMWARRVDLNILEPMTNGFRFAEGLGMFKDRLHCIPQAADDLKAIAREKLTWLDGLIGSKPFIAGDKLTLADILLYVFLDFGANVGQPLDPSNKNLAAWFERMKARPSAAASA
jgi:glutathione S-transferase